MRRRVALAVVSLLALAGCADEPDVVEVTVPPRLVSSAPSFSKPSLSHCQATSGSSGSPATESSISAWIYATKRIAPSQASSAPGSWSKIRRPNASPSASVGTMSGLSSPPTSRPIAWLNGARRCGGRMEPRVISGRRSAACIDSTAWVNAAGVAGSWLSACLCKGVGAEASALRGVVDSELLTTFKL